MKHYSIGIDVGGTNTDLVLLHKGKLTQSLKRPTSYPVSESNISGIGSLIHRTEITSNDVSHIQMGTTHMLNALLQNDVSKVGTSSVGAILRAGHAIEASPDECLKYKV